MGCCFLQDSDVNVIVGRYTSVKAAASRYGYSEQYLRRLLRDGRLDGVKIGQVWLIELDSLEEHLKKGQAGDDRRFGPQGIPVNWGGAL